MSISIQPNGSPASSGEIPILNLERLNLVNRRHRKLMDHASDLGYEAVLIQRPDNFAWLTGGGDNTRRGNSTQPIASILITQDARVVLCSNIDSAQLFEQELMGLGFQLKERHWTEDLSVLRFDICRGRRVLNDLEFSVDDGNEKKAAQDHLAAFRIQLESQERQEIRKLGADVAHAIEATARNFDSTATEAEIAAHLSHRLLKHNVEIASLQIVSDSHIWRYRSWSYSADRPQKTCVLSAVGRRHGLHVGCSRTVCTQAPEATFENEFQLATLVHATGMHFSRHDWKMSETWKRLARIYEKFEVPDEWYGVEQGNLIGYSAKENLISPNSQHRFMAGQAVHWQLGIRNTLVGDTLLIRDGDPEVITGTENWPTIGIQIKAGSMIRPGYLIREFS